MTLKIDLTCPAELWRYELPRKDYPACELMMYNLGERIIVSMELTVILTDRQGEEIQRLIYRAHDLDGRPATAFAVTVPVEDAAGAQGLEAIIDKVWFEGNSVWRRGKYALSEYTPNTLPNSRSLEMLRYVAGGNAVGFPQEQDGLWLCVCGRPNAAEEGVCARCHREKAQVFNQFNREAIEKLTAQREQQLALKAKAAREDASRLQLQREKEYEAKRRKRRRVLGAGAACVLVAGAAYGAVFHLAPYLRYRGAVSDMEGGRYAQAQAVFADMSGYADADANVNRCLYLAAKEALTADAGEDELIRARDTLIALDDYEDAAELVREADWLRANLLLQAGNTADAAALYTALDGYKDSAAQVKQCAYLDAGALLDERAFGDAYDAFIALGDYSDAAEQAKECVYQAAADALANGDAAGAIDQFSRIADYRDAQERLKEANYLWGTKLLNAGEMVAAGDAFLAAGDYQDARAQANACLYAPAQEALAAEDYQTAAGLFGRILGYEDATEQYQACTLTLARNAMKDREYQLALTLLATLPDSYEDVLELRQECVYLPATASLNGKDWQAAADGFERISTYKDSADKLIQARYGLAAQKAEEGEWETAASLYALLGDYKDSETNLLATRYGLGVKRLQEGLWNEAAAVFTELTGYRDSADKLNEAMYHQAEDAYGAGDYRAAREQFAALGGYSDAVEQVRACDYALALAAEENGSIQEAAALFASVGAYEDAEAHAQALYYTLGGQALAGGQTLTAARCYAKASGYQDAASLAGMYFDAYYQEASISAQDAMDNGEYALAAALLGHMDLTELPAKYAALSGLWQEANYQEATRLYAAGKPYEALAYYRAIPDYKDVAQRLQRTCYLLLGEWAAADGRVYTFREDGTCTLNGEKLAFRAETYALYTGATADSLTQTHSVSSISATDMTLKDMREGGTRTIRLTKVAEAEPLAAPTAAPVPEATETASPSDLPIPADDSFLVVDDEQ